MLGHKFSCHEVDLEAEPSDAAYGNFNLHGLHWS